MDVNIRDVLESSVIYDRRVASYKWLTWKLDVHPNVAKEHLQQFLNEQEADGSNVAGHSIVTGVKDKVYRVILTPRKHVEKAKKSLTSVTGAHVYSAEPANLEDVEGKLLDATTKCEHPKTSPIRCDAALETRSFTKRPPVAAKVAQSSSTSGKTSAQVSTKSVKTEKEESPAPSKPTKADRPNATSKSSKGKPKQNELAAMFSKARTASASSEAVSKSSEKPVPTKKSEEPVKNPKSSPPLKAKVTGKPKVVASTPNPTTPKKKVKVEAPESPESPVRSKKWHKRKVISDSEDEEDVPKPPAPSSDPPVSSSGATNGSTGDSKKPLSSSSEGPTPKERSKKRRRVMKSVQQTFKDDEGYLVTKTAKVMVSESDDDDDEDPIPEFVKEQAKRASASKKSAKVLGDKKQQSLLSFFGKK